jgi:hypothetical protein
VTDSPHQRGVKGGLTRAAVLSPEERSAIASEAANKRWGKIRDPEMAFLSHAIGWVADMNGDQRRRVFSYLFDRWPEDFGEP